MNECEPRAGSWQFVWWGWREWGFGWSGPWPAADRAIYRCAIRVGPVEVRQWV